MLRMDKLMEMPPLRTEVAPTDGVAFAGMGTNNTSMLDSKIDSATTAAVVTDTHDVLHKSHFSQE